MSGNAFNQTSRMMTSFSENNKRVMTARQPVAGYHGRMPLQPQDVDALHPDKQMNQGFSAPDLAHLRMQQQQAQNVQQHLSRDQFGSVGVIQHPAATSSASEHYIDLTCEENQRSQMQLLSDSDRSYPPRGGELRKSVNPDECENLIQEQLQYALAHRQKVTYGTVEKPSRLLPHNTEVYKERSAGQQGVYFSAGSTAPSVTVPQQRGINAARIYTQPTGLNVFPSAPQEAQHQALKRNSNFHAAINENRHHMQVAEKTPVHFDSYVNSNVAMIPQNVGLHHRRLSESQSQEIQQMQQRYRQSPVYSAAMPRQPHPYQPKPLQANPVQQALHASAQLSGFQPGNSKPAYMQGHTAPQVSIHCPQPIQSIHPRMALPSGQAMHYVPEQVIQSQTGQMRHAIPRQPSSALPQNPAVIAMMPQSESRTAEPPVVVDISDFSALGKECNVCTHPASFLCSKCKKAWYCSPQCQMKAWDTHSKECL